jgi:hypothetical protein
MYIIYIGILVIISIILFLIYKYRKLTIEFEETYKRNNKERIEQEELLFNKRKDEIEKNLIERKQAAEEVIAAVELRRAAVEQAYADRVAAEKEKIEIELNAHKERISQANLLAIQEEDKIQKEKAEAELVAFVNNCNLQKEQTQIELDKLLIKLNDFQQKQQVINEEILRRRQLEEQQDFFRVMLNESSLSDMQILLSIREKLISRENLDKLIYDAYISKSVTEMIKRVLKGKAPSGIYKITRLKTGEIYIGKSTDVKKRWSEHCKTAYGVGTIAHSILHTTIKKDGIENFTFELLEEVPKDKLTEREKYWITFYDSKNYGLNERNG